MDLVKYLILQIVLIRATKNVILTGLAKARDAKLLLGYLIPEIHGWLTALYATLASDCQYTAATKQLHSCILFELIHLAHHSYNIPHFSGFVKRFFHFFLRLGRGRVNTPNHAQQHQHNRRK
jgi:hypothetical protein